MPEQEPLISSYKHLKGMPRDGEALHALKKIASVVKPIMRARGWKVGELAEFFPVQGSLLGLNVDSGRRICIRLRYAGDKTQFLPFDQVTDTMLHELSHIVFGPHDAKFHALWNQLRDEHAGLLAKGYTGDGFLSEGHRLGGQQIPLHEARRLARVAAERRRMLTQGSGQKLGGVPILRGTNPRRVIADAAERRAKSLQGCGNGNHNETEIRTIADKETVNGFKTQAEEDAANEVAIAQALWELVQEEEKQKYGSLYVMPSAAAPAGTAGGRLETSPSPNNANTIAAQPSSRSSRPVPQDEAADKIKASSSSSQTRQIDAVSNIKRPVSARASSSTRTRTQEGWKCNLCTLDNPPDFLCCDACGNSRPDDGTLLARERKQIKRPRPTATSAELSHAKMVSFKNSRTGASEKPSLEPQGPAYWVCSQCDNIMERQWWTCSTCGKMKNTS